MNADVLIVGCGAAGSAIAMQLAKKGSVDSIKLADSNRGSVNKVSSQISKINKWINLKKIKIDAQNKKGLEKVLSDTTVVLNSASPM